VVVVAAALVVAYPVSVVLCGKVTRVTTRFCKTLILAVNDVLLKEPFHGLLRYMLLTACAHV